MLAYNDGVKDPRVHLATVVTSAILEGSRQEDGSIIVDAHDVRQDLTAILAMLAGTEPALDIHEKLYDACALIAAETLIEAEGMREQFLLTGKRPWQKFR